MMLKYNSNNLHLFAITAILNILKLKVRTTNFNVSRVPFTDNNIENKVLGLFILLPYTDKDNS